jgi:hypothetical protein
MTVLADAAAIYVGDVAAVAVYQGSRRIWPLRTGVEADGVLDGSRQAVIITVAATMAELQAAATTIDLTFDQGALDWAATHGGVAAFWYCSDGQQLRVFPAGDPFGGPPTLADLIAAQGAPLELRWTTGSEFELVFHP